MSDEGEQGEVVSIAERRAAAEARAAAAAREQARNQAIDPNDLPKPWLTYTLLGLNIAVWLVMVGVGVNASSPTAAELIPWGANIGVLVVAGEPWRLVSAMFLHGGIMHLAFNLYFLWVIGRICEQIYSPGPYAVVYLGSGLLGGIVSIAWQPVAVSVGASGALFGVFGAFIGFTIRRRGSLPTAFVANVRRNALVLIGINLGISLIVPGIDIAAHIGGLLAGLGLGYLLTWLGERPVSTPAEAKSMRLRATLFTAALALALTAAGGYGVKLYYFT